MTLTIQLPAEAEARLAEKAHVAGVDVPTYVQRLLQADASRPPLEEVLRPVRNAFEESGMSEDELSDMLVSAKKQMRADRPGAPGSMTAAAKRVVFDCMIYAQAMISGKGSAAACIDLVRSGDLTAIWSDYVLQEIRELPSKLPARLKLTPERVEAFVLDLAPLVSHQLRVEETYLNPFDRDDSHYVNLAIAAGANLITSRDRDLLRLMDGSLAEGRAFRLQFPNLEILTPLSLLERVRSPAST